MRVVGVKGHEFEVLKGEWESRRGKFDFLWIDAQGEEEAAAALAQMKLSDDFKARLFEKSFSRYESFEHFSYIYYRLMSSDSIEAQPVPLSVFLGKDYILTAHLASDIPEKVFQNLQSLVQRKRISPSLVLWKLMDYAVTRNGRIIEVIEDAMETMEEEVIAGRFRTESIFRLKRALIANNKVAWHGRELVLNFKKGVVSFVNSTRAFIPLYDDLYDDLVYQLDVSENLREVLTDSLNIHVSVISNKLNRSIQRLTHVTVVLTVVATAALVPNTVATIFGIPYLPIKAENTYSFLGASLYPWQIILLLILIMTILPAALLWLYWKRAEKKEGIGNGGRQGAAV